MIKETSDLTNRPFGMLVAKEIVGESITGETLWKCVCECGTIKILKSNDLVDGLVNSCGCTPHKEVIKEKSPLRELQGRLWQARMILLEVKNELDEYPAPDWGLIKWISNAKIDMRNVINLLNDIDTSLAGTAYFEEKEMELHGRNVNTRND